MKRPRIALVLLSAAALALPACAQTGARDGGGDRSASPDPAAAPGPAAAADPIERVTYTLKVSGMTCPIRCVLEVRDQLLAVPGVLRVEVDNDRKRAIVDVVPGTDPDTLVRGLSGPYSARLL